MSTNPNPNASNIPLKESIGRVSIAVVVMLALALVGGVTFLVGNGLDWGSVGSVLLVWSLVAGFMSLRE